VATAGRSNTFQTRPFAREIVRIVVGVRETVTTGYTPSGPRTDRRERRQRTEQGVTGTLTPARTGDRRPRGRRHERAPGGWIHRPRGTVGRVFPDGKGRIRQRVDRSSLTSPVRREML